MKTVDELIQLHRETLSNLANQSFDAVIDVMEYLTATDDIEAIKIILVLTKAFKDHPKITEPRKALYKHYEYLFNHFKTTYNDKD